MEGPEDLDALALKYGTDKSSGWHDYTLHYERHLKHLKQTEFTLLEIGVGPEETKGASLFMWREYFPYAHIVGLDIRPDAKSVEGERIDVEIGDSSDLDFVQNLVRKYDPQVVIDDGSHIWSHQIAAMRSIIPVLRSGSIFIMEDLHTSFGHFRQRPVFADQDIDAADLILGLAAWIMGCRKDHPRFADMTATSADLAILSRLAEISLVRSSAIMLIEDVSSSPAAAKVY